MNAVTTGAAPAGRVELVVVVVVEVVDVDVVDVVGVVVGTVPGGAVVGTSAGAGVGGVVSGGGAGRQPVTTRPRATSGQPPDAAHPGVVGTCGRSIERFCV